MPYGVDGSDKSDQYFTMQGQSVYRQAVAKMADQRIVISVAARLGIPAARCLINIAEVGNTAAASIPLALAHGVECEALRPGDHVVLTAFGGGLTWGSTLLRWPEITCES